MLNVSQDVLCVSDYIQMLYNEQPEKMLVAN